MTAQDNIAPPLPPVQQQPAGQPLSLADYAKLEQATLRAKKLRTAAMVAAFNGYTFAIFSTISAMVAFAGMLGDDIDFIGIIVTAGLGVIAYNEFKGRRMIQNFDSRAAKLLGWNQIGLILLVAVYCMWNIFSAYSGDGVYEKAIATTPELKEFLGPAAKELLQRLTVIGYALIMAVITISQGLNSLYYFTRKKLIDSYCKETPRWVIEVQKRTAK